MESGAQLLLSLFKSYFFLIFPHVTSCPRGAVPVCRGWVGFLHQRGGRQQNDFPLCVPVPAGSSTWMGCGKDVPSPGAVSMSAALKPWHGTELQLHGYEKGNSCHPSISLKAINIGMTWSLFINPPVQLAWRKGSMETGSLFALMVLTCCSEAEGMEHFNVSDYGSHKSL